MEKNITVIQRIATAMLIIIMSFIILTEAKQILYPIALAFLLSYILLPLVIFLERKLRLPNALAILISILLVITLFVVAGNLIFLQMKVFIKDFPALKLQALDNLKHLGNFVESKFHISIESQNNFIKTQFDELTQQGGEFFKTVAKNATKTIEGILFIPIFTFFMLLFRKRGKRFVLQIASTRDNKRTIEMLEQISNVTIKYVAGVFTVVVILAVCHSVALTLIGLKYALSLAIISACLSFIPYFGTLISGLVPLTFSLLMTENPYQPVIIIAYFLIITFIDHNILTPTITGGNVNLNPLVTIVGLIIAADIWGIPGMIMIVPVLAVLKIICDNIEGLEPYGFILGIDKHGIDIKKIFKNIRKKREAKKNTEN